MSKDISTLLELKEDYAESRKDLVDAVDSIYMVELFQNNVDECKDGLRAILKARAKELNVSYLNKQIEEILDFNIVCHDAYKWNYREWKPIS